MVRTGLYRTARHDDKGLTMKQHRPLRIRRNLYILLGCVLSAGCGSAVYPASACKSPPPPLTVPESPRSQCKEVSTEHAKDWPQKYKDIQYKEENAVYWMRAAFIELTDATQKQLKSDFASALIEINSADGKYLQLVDAAASSSGSDYTETTKSLVSALGKFLTFFSEHLQGAAANQLTAGAQKDINKAKVMFQELKDIVAPPAPPAGETSEDEGVISGKANAEDTAGDKDKSGDEGAAGDKDKSGDEAPADKEEK